MTLSSTSSTSSYVTAGGNKVTSSTMNFVGIYDDFKNKAYTAFITRDNVKVHLGSYKLKADAALAYDMATKLMIPPAPRAIRRGIGFNFATLKDYEKAKKKELTMLGWSKDAAMTSGEITTKVNDIVSKRCDYDFDSSGDSSEEFDESSDNDDDEDLVEDESDISPLEVSSSADIKVTEDDTKKNGNKGKLLKRDKKWYCPKCEGDVRLPPNIEGGDDEKSSVNDYLNTTHVMCALKKCPDPRYHVSIE